MSSNNNDTVTQLAFVAAFSELTGKNMVGLVEKKTGTTKNPYRVITLYVNTLVVLV